MPRNLKIYKINDDEILNKFKIGKPFFLSYPPNSKLRLNKIIAYNYDILLNEDSYVKTYEFLIDTNTYGIIIGDSYKVDFSIELSKEVYKPNIFIRCLVNNLDCLIDYRKINLL